MPYPYSQRFLLQKFSLEIPVNRENYQMELGVEGGVVGGVGEEGNVTI